MYPLNYTCTVLVVSLVAGYMVKIRELLVVVRDIDWWDNNPGESVAAAALMSSAIVFLTAQHTNNGEGASLTDVTLYTRERNARAPVCENFSVVRWCVGRTVQNSVRSKSIVPISIIITFCDLQV